MNYKEANNILESKKTGDKTTKKIDRNTYLIKRDDETIVVRLHQTDIISFKKNGTIILDSGGWRTVTTKDRMNKFLPDNYGIMQEKGIWYIKITNEYKKDLIYSDGIKLSKKTKPMNLKVYQAKQKQQTRIVNKTNKYCDRYIDALMDGKVPVPSGADCWYCSIMHNKDDENNDHYNSHIQEMYFVPSLIANAVNDCGSMYERMVLASIWKIDGAEDLSEISGMGKDMLKRTLKKYLKKRVILS